ncbi:cisplatin damage response ATP-dependent DNA ligase [Roseomonas elaeocarpi]|uniref:DNA ligase (ATP) n=1 Tax=Roseomonas elaeocarpi TaxID=907779 RepID=A0ABV6JTW9_9PROT
MSVEAFADLLERLVFTPGRLAKLALLRRWFAEQPDPDRGVGLAALTGELVFTAAKPSVVKALVAERVDPVLLSLSQDYVGDLAETVALIWPQKTGVNAPPPTLSEVVEELELASRAEVPRLIERWLDTLDSNGRYALIKLVTGALRVGVSARLAKTALAEWAGKSVEEVEEVWHGVAPPYLPIFRWLEGKAERPDPKDAPVFRPLMLAHPLEAADAPAVEAEPERWRAEWKWDGIRVQIVGSPGGQRMWSRTGEDVSNAFPEVLQGLDFHATLDGELLVMREGSAGEKVVAPFADLQQRLNRKVITAKMQAQFPVGVRLYDLLTEGEEDLRALPFDQRRERLEAWFARVRPRGMDLSPQIAFSSLHHLERLREGARAASIEGLMLKRADSPYVAGRVKGLWWKWKRAPLSVDAVVMYAQRGHGKRSSYYSDYTFGLWRDDGAGGQELVPVGKAYSGFTDQELIWLDRWIREHTTGRFGPVREVEKELVLEVIFDAAQLSTRHRSGVAMRFPRIARIRRDKPAAEADRLDTLMAMVEGSESEAA